MCVKDVKLIKVGTLTIEAFERPDSNLVAMKYFCGVGGGSTITYIETEDRKIIVDTGFEYETDISEGNKERNQKILVEAMGNFGLSPDDIDCVFITHWHRDHFGNIGVFKDAEIIVLKSLADHFGLDFTGVSDDESIAEGVNVLATPGHTEHHASVVLQTERLVYKESFELRGRISGIGSPRIVVAGDAIVSYAYFIQNKVWDYNSDFFSAEKARESIKKISAVADFIIPGHGGLFRNVRKKMEL